MTRLAKLARRLTALLATALLGGLLTATLVRYSPGFDADERTLDPRLSAESREVIRAEHDASRSVLSFYYSQLRAMAHGDFGMSRSLNRPIAELVASRLPVTLEVMAFGVAGGWALGLGLALAAVLCRGRTVSRVAAAVMIFARLLMLPRL